ncbi:Zinc finger CW-type PWWP domain protein 1 like protein [Argiope bruennichi]|uniref:Zinc finger CW-type PWWP domain protein 1 like protein n=1 Tax=Argiope bruennichi TaxID=94029 RepID=A0A8T0E1K4_ARGBR|nr:Zinc finger CW-type PWWP domain protein 1 like protein [Argiope bruennichi]
MAFHSLLLIISHIDNKQLHFVYNVQMWKTFLILGTSFFLKEYFSAIWLLCQVILKRMTEINQKIPKKSSRERHLKWMRYYGSKNFGIFIECTKCKKWRKSLKYSESHEVPMEWDCSMLTSENGGKGSCSDPEEENAEGYLEYAPGSVVWAKLEGYPWWPAMVDGNPDTDEYAWQEKDTVYYNVTFLDKKPTHAWIPNMYICPYLETPKTEKGYLQKLRKNKYAGAIAKAKERAEKALGMTIKDRLQTYSFVHLYKGPWPAVSDLEECYNEENGSSSDVPAELKSVSSKNSVCRSPSKNGPSVQHTVRKSDTVLPPLAEQLINEVCGTCIIEANAIKEMVVTDGRLKKKIITFAFSCVGNLTDLQRFLKEIIKRCRSDEKYVGLQGRFTSKVKTLHVILAGYDFLE